MFELMKIKQVIETFCKTVFQYRDFSKLDEISENQ